MFALGQVFVDIRLVRDTWNTITNMYQPNNTNIQYAWRFIYTTAIYFAELIVESFIRKIEASDDCVNTHVFGGRKPPVQFRLV